MLKQPYFTPLIKDMSHFQMKHKLVWSIIKQYSDLWLKPHFPSSRFFIVDFSQNDQIALQILFR